jgi:CheY-like chemotaxis protein
MSQRVLAVDDNHDAVESLGILLHAEGYETRTAINGVEALRIFQAWNPEIVILDIGMPGFDGYEVAQRIRALKPREQVLLIALTGWSQKHHVERAFAAGFDHHIVKPGDPGALIKMLRAWSGRPLATS